jgi:hypothetical protein
VVICPSSSDHPRVAAWCSFVFAMDSRIARWLWLVRPSGHRIVGEDELEVFLVVRFLHTYLG